MALEASSEAYDTWVMFVLHNQMSCVYFLCQLIYKGVRNFRIALHDFTYSVVGLSCDVDGFRFCDDLFKNCIYFSAQMSLICTNTTIDSISGCFMLWSKCSYDEEDDERVE